jgi:glycosyltransferase involved in cell wall biosynthesis
MTAPRFSIIIVCLNAETELPGALDSVLSQTWPDRECVVVDGASSDGTVDVLRAYERRFEGLLRWVSEPDDGLYHAMNKGLALARGDYVEFLGADDRLRPAALESVARVLAMPEPPDIVCGTTHVVGPSGGHDEEPRRVVRRGMPARMPASHQATFVRRELIAEVGGFDPRFRIAADYDLYLRLIRAGATEAFTPDVLADFRLGGVSSRSAWDTAREYRDVRIAHGASPGVETLVMVKAALGATAFAAWKWMLHRVRTSERTGDRG